jgi:hypothetical protein
MTTTLTELAKTKEFLAALALLDAGKLSAGMFAFDDLESRLSTKDWATLQTWLMDGGPEPWKVPETTAPRTFTQADTKLVASYGDDLLTSYFKQKEGTGKPMHDSTEKLLQMMGR